MALSSQWILVRTLNSFFSTYLLHLIYCRSFHHSHSSSKLVRPWWSLSWLVLNLISLLALKQSQSMIPHSISAFSTLTCGTSKNQLFRTVGPTVAFTSRYNCRVTVQRLFSKKSLEYHLYAETLEKTHLYTMCTVGFRVSVQRILLSF